MEIPGRINFLQLGRFGRKSEQCYRQTFEREDMDWMEFNYRDAKQFTGLTHCQARSSNKLDFAYNASFAAVNVAKALRRDLGASLSINLTAKKLYFAKFVSITGLIVGFTTHNQ